MLHSVFLRDDQSQQQISLNKELDDKNSMLCLYRKMSSKLPMRKSLKINTVLEMCSILSTYCTIRAHNM